MASSGPQAVATPSKPGNSIKHKYSKFVEKVKMSAEKAKDKAQQKRRLSNKINAYKKNDLIIQSQIRRKKFTISTKQLNDAAPTSSSESMEIEEQKENEQKGIIINDDWTCIIVEKKQSPTTPKQAPPPIPHSRRKEFLKKSNKRKLSDSLQNIFKKRKKKQSQDEENINADASYDEDAFNLDSGLEETMNDNSCNELLQTDDKPMANTKSIVRWQWCDDQEKWNNFGKSSSKEIEESYANKLDEYEYDVFGRIYTINFIHMIQSNNLGQTWNVRRQQVKKC